MENLNGLKIFVRVSETLSFVETGRQLGLSASAIGKAIARLEHRLGVRLLNRNTHDVSLTAEGLLFLRRSRRILSEVELAAQELSESRQSVGGPMRISIPTWATTFMPIFARFIQAFPKLKLELDLSDRLVDIVAEGYDLVIRTGEIQSSSMMTKSLDSFRHVLVASPTYLATHGIPHSPASLQAHLCLHRRHPETGQIEPWPLFDGDANLDLELPIAAIANSVDARIELAEHGAGIACVPAICVDRQLEDGRLISLLDSSIRNAGALHLLWASGATPSRNVRALIDYLTQAGLNERLGSALSIRDDLSTV